MRVGSIFRERLQALRHVIVLAEEQRGNWTIINSPSFSLVISRGVTMPISFLCWFFLRRYTMMVTWRSWGPREETRFGGRAGVVSDGPRGKSLDLGPWRWRWRRWRRRIVGERIRVGRNNGRKTTKHDLAGVVRDDDYDDGDGNWRLGAFWVGNLWGMLDDSVHAWRLEEI